MCRMRDGDGGWKILYGGCEKSDGQDEGTAAK